MCFTRKSVTFESGYVIRAAAFFTLSEKTVSFKDKNYRKQFANFLTVLYKTFKMLYLQQTRII